MDVLQAGSHMQAPGGPLNHQMHGRPEQTGVWHETQYMNIDSGIPSSASSIYSDQSSTMMDDSGYYGPNARRNSFGPRTQPASFSLPPQNMNSEGTPRLGQPPAYQYPNQQPPGMSNHMQSHHSVPPMQHPQRPTSQNPQQMTPRYPPGQGQYGQHPVDPMGGRNMMQMAPGINGPHPQSQSVINELQELSMMVRDHDSDVINGSAQVLERMSGNPQKLADIARNPMALDLLINTLQFVPQNADPRVKAIMNANQAVMRLIHTVSKYPDCAQMITRSGLPAILRHLDPSFQNICNYIIGILHNVMPIPGAKDQIIVNGGIERLVASLEGGSVKYLHLVCECLKLLREAKLQLPAGEDVKIHLIRSGAAEKLLRIFSFTQEEKPLLSAATLLRGISGDREGKEAILQCDPLVSVLSSCLKNCSFETTKVPVTVLTVIRNMSDLMAQKRIQPLDNLLEVVVPFLTKRAADHRIHPLLSYAAGILCNLTAFCPSNKAAVCRFNGMLLLLEVLDYVLNPERRARNPTLPADADEDLLEVCVVTLRHITSGHPTDEETEAARNIFVNMNGLHIVARVLIECQRIDVIKASVHCIFTLSANPRNHIQLRNIRVFGRLLDLMRQCFESIVQSKFDPNISMPVGPKGPKVRFSDVLALIILTLANFSDESSMSELIYHPEFIHFILELLRSFKAENVLRACTVVIKKFIEDPRGAKFFDNNQIDLIGLLLPLIQRHVSDNKTNQETAENAAQIIDNILQRREDPRIDRNNLRAMVSSYGYGENWCSVNVQPHNMGPGLDYMMNMDDFRNYHASGPPSVYSSIYSTSVSTYDPDNMSGMNMPPHVPNQQIRNWDNYSVPTPGDPSQNMQGGMYHNMMGDGMH